MNDFEKWSTKSYATYTQSKSLEFNLANYTEPISTDHARAQRQQYDIIRKNCVVTTNLVTHALHLSDDDAVCAHAFHGIFRTLKTMLANEVTRAEAINLRAMNYWHHHVVLAILDRMNNDMNLPSPDEWDSLSISHPTQVLTMKQTMDRLRAIHQHHRQHRNDRFTMGEHANLS